MAGSRNTTTGAVLEAMILPSLTRGGYDYRQQVSVGKRLGGRAHKVDAVAEKNGRCWLISMKWQQVSGTAEQKVPFEAMCLEDAIMTSSGGYCNAYLVLGGGGWSLREYFTSGGLSQYMNTPHVSIVTLEHFIGLANMGNL